MSSTLRLRRHTFFDSSGFGQRVEAFSMLLPADWTVAGEVRWAGTPGTPPCMGSEAQLFLEARSRDGLWGFDVLPAPSVAWIDVRRVGYASPFGSPFSLDPEPYVRSARADLARAMHQRGSVCRVTQRAGIEGLAEEALLPVLRPRARILEREDLPEARRMLQRQMDEILPPAAMFGGPQMRMLAASYRIADTAPGGPVEESLFFAAGEITSEFPMDDQFVMVSREAKGVPVFVARFPAGQSKAMEPLLAVIVGSLRTSPRWDAAMAAHRASMSEIAIKGARDRSQIWADVSAEISDMQMQGWQLRQESADRMQALTSDQIREVRPVRDPVSGREFELPNYYETFYQNAQGEFLMSTDPGFRASDVFPHENWTRLEHNPR